MYLLTLRDNLEAWLIGPGESSTTGFLDQAIAGTIHIASFDPSYAVLPELDLNQSHNRVVSLSRFVRSLTIGRIAIHQLGKFWFSPISHKSFGCDRL